MSETHISTSEANVFVRLTRPRRVGQVHLRDESVSVGPGLPEVSRFGVDHMTLTIRVQNLQPESSKNEVGSW